MERVLIKDSQDSTQKENKAIAKQAFKKTNSTKSNFVKGFTWLAVGSLIAKLLGGLYKILLTNVIGGENIGVYQQLLPIYTFIIVLVSAGVPLGVSKMLAKFDTLSEKNSAMKTTLLVFWGYSFLLSLFLALSSRFITSAQGQTEFWFVYIILSPAIVLSSLSAVYKGYFQSLENFRPTAISNIVEQIFKIGFSLGVILLFVSSSFTQIVVAVTSITIGELFGFLSLYIMKRKSRNIIDDSEKNTVETKFQFNKEYLKDIVTNVLPIMITGLILPFSHLIDSFLVVRLLNKNFEANKSVYLYGLQTGVVGALINVPTTISFAVVSVLLPSLSKDFKNNNFARFNSKFSLAFKLILLITIPCFVFLLVYPKNIINLIYGSNLNAFNMDGQMISARLLFWSSSNVVFLCLANYFSVCLQARNCTIMPIVNSLIGIVIKLILELIFIPARQINILSFTLASVIAGFAIVVLNGYQLIRENLKFVEIKELLKIIFATLVALSISLILGTIGLNNVTFVLICLLSIVVYLLTIWKLKLFSKSELKSLVKNKISE